MCLHYNCLVKWFNCDIISNRLWCHQQNTNTVSRTWSRSVKIVSYHHVWIHYVMQEIKWYMQCHDQLLTHTHGCYFCVYFPCCFATREISTKITLKWVHNQFITQVHILFFIQYWFETCIRNKVPLFLCLFITLFNMKLYCIPHINNQDDVRVRKFSPHYCYLPFVRVNNLEPTSHPNIDNFHKELVMQSFNVYFVVSLNKQLQKKYSHKWFETPWHSCWQ